MSAVQYSFGITQNTEETVFKINTIHQPEVICKPCERAFDILLSRSLITTLLLACDVEYAQSSIRFLCLLQEGVMSVEDIDKVMSEGLGRRYAFMGPLETAYLNADG